MLIFLSGVENTKDAPNENYGRELMELFTLGAGRGYTERDVREQARALTGWDADWKDGVGQTNFRFLSKRHDTGVKTIFGKKGRFDWRDSCHLCLEHPSHPSFFVEKLWSYFVPVPPDGATQAALEQLYKGGNYEIRPLVDAILRHPALYLGPRDGEAAGRLHGRAAARARARDRHRRRGSGSNDEAGQRLFYPPNVAGWDDSRWLDTATFRGRWDVAGYALRTTQLDPNKVKAKLPLDAEKLLTRALTSMGSPSLDERTQDILLGFAQRALGDAKDDWKKKSVPGDDRERAAPADRDLARRGRCRDATTAATASTSRARSCCARAAAEAGRGLPTIEPGMPLPAGTGLSRRSFLAKSAGLALAVYGAGSLGLRQLEEGIASAATGPAKTVLVSIFLEGGADALSVLYPDGDPLYRKLRPKLALPSGAGPAFADDARLRWHPALAPLAQLARRGEGRLAARGRLHASRPVALHLAPLLGGGGDRPAPAHGLARPLPRRRRDDGQPAAGALARRTARAVARDSAKVPVAAIEGVSYDFWTRNVWGQVEERMLDTLRATSARRSAPTRRLAAASAVTDGRPTGCARSSQPFSGDKGVTSPVAYPKSDDSFAAASRGARGDARGRPAASLRRAQRAGRLRHARRPGRTTSPRASTLTAREPARLPARPRGARPRRPRARARVVRVRAARARRTARRAPTTARRASAS